MLIKKKSRSGKKVKPNRRSASAGKANASAPNPRRKNIRNSAEPTITGGHTPHYGQRKKKKGEKSSLNLPSITPWKVILTSFLIGICGFIYITHVFSTQQLLEEVQQLEHEFNRTSRIHSEMRLAYDRMVGPREIYERAREEGFVNAGPADQVIFID